MVATIELNSHDIKVLCERYLTEDHLTTTYQSNVAFTILKYKLKPTSDAPAGFLGRHQFLCVKIQRDLVVHENNKEKPEECCGDDSIERLCFFTKSAPNDIASHLQYIEEFGVFKKEILVYRDVLPNLQRATFASVAPKCFYADNNLLVFENLMEQGFKMSAARDGLLNYEHLTCALKTIAAMHAGSILFEQRQCKKIPELYADAVIENSYPSGVNDNHMRMRNFNNANRVLCEILKVLPKYKDNLSHILKEFPRKMHKIFDLARPSKRYQNVFSHGDLWANNIMFSYGKYGEVPIDCRLVDFQLARYSPPMLDLLTVLTIPTSREFRERYMLELLCDYYRFMSEFLRRESLNIEDFLPKDEFFASVAEFRIAGLIESLLFSHLTILPPDLTSHLTSSADGFSDFFDRKRVEICMKAFNTDRVYRERLTETIEDFVDNFVLA